MYVHVDSLAGMKEQTHMTKPAVARLTAGLLNLVFHIQGCSVVCVCVWGGGGEYNE